MVTVNLLPSKIVAERARDRARKRIANAKHPEKNRGNVQKWRERYPERAKAAHRDAQILRFYGLTPNDVAILCHRQGDACAICRVAFADLSRRNVHIDHDHATGLVRGVLCAHCNHMLGSARDRADVLDAAAEYIRRTKASTR